MSSPTKKPSKPSKQDGYDRLQRTAAVLKSTKLVTAVLTGLQALCDQMKSFEPPLVPVTPEIIQNAQQLTNILYDCVGLPVKRELSKQVSQNREKIVCCLALTFLEGRIIPTDNIVEGICITFRKLGRPEILRDAIQRQWSQWDQDQRKLAAVEEKLSIPLDLSESQIVCSTL